jgi:hypothetical protein
MEERQPRIPPHSYQSDRNLAPYSYSADADHLPLEEDANVVPMKPRLDGVAETPLNSRSTKRKSSGRSNSAKQKTAQSFRQFQQNSAHQPFAEELRRLETQAERINQILSDRARNKTTGTQPAQSAQRHSPPTEPHQWQAQQIYPARSHPDPDNSVHPAQPRQYDPASPALDNEDTEYLKLQARQIRQRLTELEGLMEEPVPPPSPMPSAPPWQVHEQSRHDQSRYEQPRHEQPRHEQSYTSGYGQNAMTGWQAAEDRRQSTPPYGMSNKAMSPDAARAQQPQEKMYYPTPSNYSAPSGRPVYEPAPAPSNSPPSSGRTKFWRYLELPRKPFDRFGDAVLWIAASAVLRVGLRYVLAAFPALSPVLSALMLAPAALALYLAFCVPKAGWVTIYRLFLITIGLLVGGKF